MIAKRHSENPTRLSATEQVVLFGIATLEGAYGLQLCRHCKLQRGTVYVILRRLAERGFVTSNMVPLPDGERGPSRRVYAATEQGVRALVAWEAALQAWVTT